MASGSPAHHLRDLLQRDLVVARVLLGQSPRGREGSMSPVQPVLRLTSAPPTPPMQGPVGCPPLC